MGRLKLVTAGESHGPQLTAILDGMPAGVPVDHDALRARMKRRQQGFGVSPRMKIEADEVAITSGVIQGKTTGAPIALAIVNQDRPRWRDRDIEPMVIPRPGHADLVGALKFGYDNLRFSLERASARETAIRTAAASIVVDFLGTLGVQLGGFVTRIGSVDAGVNVASSSDALLCWTKVALGSTLGWPVATSEVQATAAVQAALDQRDTVGGQIVAFALGLPPGLGSFTQADRRLDGALAQAVMAVPSCKGVEVGPAFDNTHLPGTEVHDAIVLEGDRITRASNRAGGLEGGVTTGQPVVVRAALKPISTTIQPQASVNLLTGEAAEHRYERSDTCAVSRAVVILESVIALVIADAVLEKTGGDSLSEIKSRFDQLPRGRVDEFALHGERWRLSYPGDEPA